MKSGTKAYLAQEGSKIVGDLLRVAMSRPRKLSTSPESEKEASPEEKAITTQEPAESPKITAKGKALPISEEIATACVPCGIGHYAGAAKLLNEAFRFRDDGIESNQVLDDIAGAIGELNAMERVDLTPEKLQNTSNWERPLADEALKESRKLRHRLEGISSMEEIEKAAADAESYYKRLNRQWYKGRFAHIGQDKAELVSKAVAGVAEPEITLKEAKQMAAEEAQKQVEKKWQSQEKK